MKGHLPYNRVLLMLLIASTIGGICSADTVIGGGYSVEQTFAPIDGTAQGGGYTLEQASQQHGGQESGSGHTLQGVFGGSVTATTTPPPPTGGGGGGGGGGYFVYLQPQATGTIIIKTASGTQILPATGSTCTTRVTFSAPIDYGLATNVPADVKKLETFLNTYEHERLPVNGIYEKRDVDAVKRWQVKYRSYILDPMQLKQPTGTVYTLSQRQIERQTSASCGVPVVVTACPYFKDYVAYGDRGESVKRVQLFLNIVRGEQLPVSGVYGPLTRAATKRFQTAYKKDILNILKLSFISGNWNEATREKANINIGCTSSI